MSEKLSFEKAVLLRDLKNYAFTASPAFRDGIHSSISLSRSFTEDETSTLLVKGPEKLATTETTLRYNAQRCRLAGRAFYLYQTSATVGRTLDEADITARGVPEEDIYDYDPDDDEDSDDEAYDETPTECLELTISIDTLYRKFEIKQKYSLSDSFGNIISNGSTDEMAYAAKAPDRRNGHEVPSQFDPLETIQDPELAASTLLDFSFIINPENIPTNPPLVSDSEAAMRMRHILRQIR